MITVDTGNLGDLVDRLATRRRALFVWGAGAAGRAAIAELQRHALPVAGVIDANPATSGTTVADVPVHVPEHLTTLRPKPRVLIASMYWRDIGERLRGLGFRPERDFEVFPASLDSLQDGASTARRYASWHHRWRSQYGLNRRTTRAPRVGIIQVPAATGRKALTNKVAGMADGRWVLLVDASVRHPRWQWRHGFIPDQDVVAAPAIFDHPAPEPGRRDAPFLLEALLGSVSLADPVLCRAGTLRACLEEMPDPVPLQCIAEWLQRRGFNDTHEPVGACRMARVRPPQRPRPVLPRAPAPALVQFVASLAATRTPMFSSAEIASVLPAWSAATVDPVSGLEYLHRRRTRPATSVSLDLRCHAAGNTFFTEIRDFLAASWKRAGARVSVGDQSTPPAPPPTRTIVIAPHEFFVLNGRHRAWEDAGDVVLVNTEQPQTRWFASSVGVMLRSTAVLDLNWQTALLLRSLGINAHFLPLGWDARQSLGAPRRLMPASPALAGMSVEERRLPAGDAWADRPIDVLFIGTLSPRRSRALAALAPVLARYRCFLHVPPSSSPLVAGSADSLDARDTADLCRRSKVVLNIHRDDLPYCEWHRVMFQAMRHGALVLTEPMMRVPVFRSGRDFLAADLEHMPRVLCRTLESRGGRRRAQEVAAAGTTVLRRHFDAARIARRSLDLL